VVRAVQNAALVAVAHQALVHELELEVAQQEHDEEMASPVKSGASTAASSAVSTPRNTSVYSPPVAGSRAGPGGGSGFSFSPCQRTAESPGGGTGDRDIPSLSSGRFVHASPGSLPISPAKRSKEAVAKRQQLQQQLQRQHNSRPTVHLVTVDEVDGLGSQHSHTTMQVGVLNHSRDATV
jgi:hypothetical protein